MDAFKASGTSPTAEPDFRCENHGSVFLLQPLTSAANDWIEANLPEDHMTFAGAVCVEHRYIVDIVRGAIADGLQVEFPIGCTVSVCYEDAERNINFEVHDASKPS